MNFFMMDTFRQAPDRKVWNGRLKGYYIGYRIADENHWQYKTLELANATSVGRHHEVEISSLKPFTAYVIMVQVFNYKGTGPRSDEITVTTLEDGTYLFTC